MYYWTHSEDPVPSVVCPGKLHHAPLSTALVQVPQAGQRLGAKYTEAGKWNLPQEN